MKSETIEEYIQAVSNKIFALHRTVIQRYRREKG